MTVLFPQAVDPEQWAAATWPLGASYDPADSTVSFAVYSPPATRVLLEIYRDATGSDAYAEFVTQQGTDGVWRAKVGQLGPGVLYAYRVWGRNWEYVEGWTRGGSNAGFLSDVDTDGNRYNPNNVLFDPYAREITHTLTSGDVEQAGGDGGAFGTGGGIWQGRPRREVDTGRWAPKGVVIQDVPFEGDKPRVAPQDAVVYETHLIGLSAHPSTARLTELLAAEPGFGDVADVPDELRGTYAGAGYLAPYLNALGVTTVEFLPVQETNLAPYGEAVPNSNYWGYQTLAYFAPNRAYAADRSPGGPTREFREMCAAFHAHGIEVYIDVVYNHTGEGGNWGNKDTVGFVSLGGFATNEYYVLGEERFLIDGATGSGNQFDLDTPASQAVVTDSLKYWADVLGVDGFRFDLAPVLGRSRDGFSNQHPLLGAIVELAEERHIEIVAEAWDLWGYEVGSFPDGWAEWNGHFRDNVRDFLRGQGNTHGFIDVFNGDYARFADQGGAHRSINFVVAHDGFTLMDLVSYNTKHNNQPPPFGPSDGGSDNNRSWDSGQDQALRRARWRDFYATLFLARGVPMIVAGDEYGRTQNGNNNPWSLHTIAFWNNYAAIPTNTPTRVPVDPALGAGGPAYHDVVGQGATPEGVSPLFRFATYLGALRRRHPALRQATYGDGGYGGSGVSYLFARPDGSAPQPGDRALRVCIDGSGIGASDLLVLINMWDHPVDFALMERDSGEWRRIVDTAAWAEPHANCWELADADVVGGGYAAHPWSIVVLESSGSPG